MNKEDNERLIVLLQKTPDTKYFDQYKEFYQKITGDKLNQVGCNKCALRRIIRVLNNYKNGIQ